MIKRPVIDWFRLNRTLHRDIGYFCIGLTVVFAVSGLALNHVRDFNPNYEIVRTQLPLTVDLTQSDQKINDELLNAFAIQQSVKATYWESKNTYKLFFEAGHTLTYHHDKHVAVFEAVESRPILPHLNRLHLNEAKASWVVFSDIYAVCLLYLALSALFMVRGKNGALSKKKIGIVLAGVAIPLIYIFL